MWESVHPQPNRYNFDPVDRFVEFGEKNKMWIVGHTLVWHNQTPMWAFEVEVGKPIANMKEHISTVVGRYKGRIHAWDVVNEAIADNGTLRTGPVGEPGKRGEPWHSAIGDEYIEMAFRWAQEADPNAELYYNDFNEWFPAKIEAISKLITSLKAKGVRVDGLGLQGHWGLDWPTHNEIDHMLTEYGKLGVKLMITELDVTVLPLAPGVASAEVTQKAQGGDEMNPYRSGLPEDMQKKLAERYADIFKLFVKHADKIDRVTFWGVHDGGSWRNGFPIRGRTYYPLVFDRHLQPKPAFRGVF
jgi:endo-1,4-beta-xylanase